METRLTSLWDQSRASFWFVPSLFLAVGIMFGFTLPMLDLTVDFSKYESIWLQTTTAGSRSVLSTIAGSMVTVAGVVFSLNMVTLSIASGQYGSRVLRSRMEDNTAQVAMGSLLATSVYCFLVLRTLQDRDDYVPVLSVNAAIIMAIACLMILIYFVHEVASEIQAPRIVEALGYDLNASIERLYPERIGQARPADGEPSDAEMEQFHQDCAAVDTTAEGYLQGIDVSALLHAAKSKDVIIELRKRPGDFITTGDAIADVGPPDKVDDDLLRAIRETLIVGTNRTPRQDVNCAVHELVQVAIRALSPGINDSFTAMNSIDRLGAALCRLALSEIPSAYRYDSDDKLRVIARPCSFAEVLGAAFNQIRQSGADSEAATLRLMEALSTIAARVRREEDKEAIEDQLQMIDRASRENFADETAQATILKLIERTRERMIARRQDAQDDRESEEEQAGDVPTGGANG
ncbi:DUF2254 domain-containing protein [Blastopirellula sp. J2-11]|uniref:DUF2254 domain-containing protein n=1 Tax=Blastopirellula sp. J2-11 TaxID=2943192 RepID=UPI0021CAA28D|nr:DUF2254 domain-containing protein [Blastopirellula sp. J2-11]UUO06845.1 DUF2254 domain-containing protein [Blastopirellula sp. J2-11]